MIVNLLTKQQLEFLSLKGGCTCSSESTLSLVKKTYCWKSHVTAHSINNTKNAQCALIVASVVIRSAMVNKYLLFCQPKVTVTSCLVYKVIRDF